MTSKTLATVGLTALAMIGASALIANAQLGPLDPPAGLVADTGPSLAEIDAKLDALAAGSALTDGPWEVRTFTPGNSDQLTSIEIASGRVLVHRVASIYGDFFVFDGQGGVSADGVATTPNAVGFARQAFGSGPGSQFTSVSHEVNVVVENGLHACWNSRASTASFQVFFKRLDDQGATE